MEVDRAMSTEPENTTAESAYQLACTDCEFAARVDGSGFDALDVAETHREEHGETYTEHFVDFELIEDTD